MNQRSMAEGNIKRKAKAMGKNLIAFFDTFQKGYETNTFAVSCILDYLCSHELKQKKWT